ncbi:MAG: RNA-binding transcriptional accessory protein, partial [Deltaproteobacteria bacterium]|nr:RNA-binding transcriptional accessory protein [Kofleriaceae bacterium]
MSDPTPASTPDLVHDLVPDLAKELGLPPAGVRAVVDLLAEGNTVPFIARYRKERTGGLDEVQIRAIEERQAYRKELEERRATVLASITEQGKLTDELAARIKAADTKAALEDLYAPFRPRRKTRAMTARERGLEPLAQRILAQPADGDPAAEAGAFVQGEVGSAADALAGARDIVAEIVADTAEVRALCRAAYGERGEVVSERVAETTTEPTKYEAFYDFREPVATIPSHRFLAIRRGEAEGFLRAQIAPGGGGDELVAGIERLMKLDAASPWASLLREAIADAHKRLLGPAIENDVRAELKLKSDAAAVDVFAGNLRHLLLQAPLGGRSVIGVDPGLRTGCKCAAVDATGRYLGSITIFLTQGEAAMQRAREELAAFIKQYDPAAIAVGNGTGGRDAEAFVRKLLAAEPAPVPLPT